MANACFYVLHEKHVKLLKCGLHNTQMNRKRQNELRYTVTCSLVAVYLPSSKHENATFIMRLKYVVVVGMCLVYIIMELALVFCILEQQNIKIAWGLKEIVLMMKSFCYKNTENLFLRVFYLVL